MRQRIFSRGLVLVVAIQLFSSLANAQSPTIDAQESPPGTTVSRLGTAPGAGANPLGTSPGADERILGGRAGSSTPRVLSSESKSGMAISGPRSAMSPSVRLRAADTPIYGPLAIPGQAENEGPPNGLTLDASIERIVHANLDLRSKFMEIPQAQADILTAGLRANPIFFADSQLIPYGSYTKDRPGGELQYDVNVTMPLDLSRKRTARTQVATQAKRVLEAQYQDAVRLQIDNLYTAFVDVLAAREAARYAKTSVDGIGKLLLVTREQWRKGDKTEAEFNKVKILHDTAEIGLLDAEEALQDAKRALGPLLNINPNKTEDLEIRGMLRDTANATLSSEEMVKLALRVRPDLAAYRLGVTRSVADVKLARANRYQDVYLLAQPYTFQDNQPIGLKSATSYALGVTVPLPVFNRNQGNIERAKLNVTQSEIDLAGQEQQVITEVQRAERQYVVSLVAVTRLEKDVLITANIVYEEALNRYRLGEEDVIVYINAQRELNDVVRQYMEALIRHRRAMLRLNTVVGQRILP